MRLDLIVWTFVLLLLLSQGIRLLPDLDILDLEDLITAGVVSSQFLQSSLDFRVFGLDFRAFLLKLALLLLDVVDLLLLLLNLLHLLVLGGSDLGVFNIQRIVLLEQLLDFLLLQLQLFAQISDGLDQVLIL